MTRQEIEGYLLHARTSPETFVLDEQADLLEADIAAAVEKAVAEEREAWIAALKAVCGESKCHPDFAAMWAKAEADPTYWAELLGLSMDAYRNLEARHAREIERARLEERVSMIDKWALCVCPFTGGTRFGATDPECPGCKDLKDARAALAALEVKP